MKINSFKNPTNVPSPEDLQRYVSIALEDIVNVINGNVGFKDNCQVSLSSVNIVSPNVDTIVNHNLGRTPDGYIVVSNPKGVIYKDGVAASTDKIITIQGDRVGTLKVLVF